MGENGDIWRSGMQRAGYALGIALAYYGLAWVGLRFSVPPHNITVLWPPNGFVLAVLLLSDRRRWSTLIPAAILSQLVFNLSGNLPRLLVAGFFVGNSLEMVATAALLRRLLGPTVTLRRVREVVYLCGMAALVCLGSGLVPALSVMSAFPAASFQVAWQDWTVGDVMGVVVLTPVILTWAPLAMRARGARGRAVMGKRGLEAIALFALLSMASYLIFATESAAGQAQIPMMYLIFPFVLWAAVRLGPPGASLASLVVTVFAVSGAALGRGPRFFGPADVSTTVYWIQIYLLVVLLSGLVLSAVWSERTDAAAALEESQERLARTEAFALVMTTHFDIEGRWLKVPPTLCERLRYKEDKLLGQALKDVVHPDDFDAFWASCLELLGGRAKSADREVRLRRRRGKTIWVDMSLSLVTDASDKPVHFLGHVRDITERKRAEEALQQTLEDLTRANEALALEVEERRRAEAIITQQANEIFEMSTPIVKLQRGVELVPLIGAFDSRRAQQLMTRLFERVASEGSSGVLLDVTGVPSIDVETAAYLLKIIGGVRLLGAEAVLTGVRPKAASALVALGIDLGDIEAQASLSAGFRYLLRKEAQRGPS